MNKNALFLIAAVVLGLIAALITVMHVRERVAIAEEQAARSVPRFEETEVVVSRRDLHVGDVLQEPDMASRRVPVDFVPADAIIPGDHQWYINQTVRTPIKQGAPLSAGALVAAEEQFSRVIQPGRVGYTLSVNENNSISGMITPGDRVDIMLTFDSDRDISGGNVPIRKGSRVVTLLENILVLATGQRIVDLPDSDDTGGYSSVTLELDPGQAEELTIGQQAGSLRVLLRNLDDQTPFGLRGTTERELLTSFGDEDHEYVEFIIGGQ